MMVRSIILRDVLVTNFCQLTELHAGQHQHLILRNIICKMDPF